MSLKINNRSKTMYLRFLKRSNFIQLFQKCEKLCFISTRKIPDIINKKAIKFRIYILLGKT